MNANENYTLIEKILNFKNISSGKDKLVFI